MQECRGGLHRQAGSKKYILRQDASPRIARDPETNPEVVPEQHQIQFSNNAAPPLLFHYPTATASHPIPTFTIEFLFFFYYCFLFFIISLFFKKTINLIKGYTPHCFCPDFSFLHHCNLPLQTLHQLLIRG